jgi:4'-phosphopantetheinyl transferase EntD
MIARSSHSPIAVALATVEDLPAARRSGRNAERWASRIAARRAIRSIVGQHSQVVVRRRDGVPPLVRVRTNDGAQRDVSLSLTHRDGRAAAVAAWVGTHLGIDLERLHGIDPSHERFFLTKRERSAGGGVPSAALWTLKEAAWKALRLDGSVAFHELELDIGDAFEVRGVRCRGKWRRMSATIACPWPGYVMAVVHLERAA